VSAPSFRGQSLLPRLFGAPGKEAVMARSAEDQPKYALRDARFKLIDYSARGTQELYDLEADPDERQDLASERPLRTAFYRQALHRFLLALRRGPQVELEPVELSDEEKDNLRALGYIQ
jgi:arylsulfatase A-like enzyme